MISWPARHGSTQWPQAQNRPAPSSWLKTRLKAREQATVQYSLGKSVTATGVRHMAFRLSWPKLRQMKQVVQLSQSDRAAGWVSYGPKWKTGTGRQYNTEIISQYSNTVTYLASKAIEFGEKRKIRAITPFKVIQGHRCLLYTSPSPRD